MSDVPHETASKTPFVASAKSGRGDSLPQLPDAGIFQFAPVGAKPPLEPPAEREARWEPEKPPPKSVGNSMFEALVTSENDLVGFVAYGFYKQSKRDFLTVFEQAHARAPDATEIRAYMTGEATPRRVTTYRHLAERFLASYGDSRPADDEPAAAMPSATKTNTTSNRLAPKTLAQFLARPMVGRGRRGPGWLAAAYIAFLILLLVGMAILIRGGFSPLGGFGR